MNQSNDAPLPLSVQLAATPSHEQLQSPLFTTLFPELRTIIFTIALTEYDDKTRPYSKHSWCYRPGFTHAGKISTGLLATCRRVYFEAGTHTAAVALNEHVFWMNRHPEDNGRRIEFMLPAFSEEQRAKIDSVRFFAQMYWLEGRRALRAPRLALDFADLASNPTLPPLGLNPSPIDITIPAPPHAPPAHPQTPTNLPHRALHPQSPLTIRHSDWWYWEQHQPLRMDRPEKSWGAWIGSIPGIEVLELELETIDAKKAELEGIVRGAVGWRIPLNADGEEGEGWVLVHDGERPRESMWLGTSALAPPGNTRVGQTYYPGRRRGGEEAGPGASDGFEAPCAEDILQARQGVDICYKLSVVQTTVLLYKLLLVFKFLTLPRESRLPLRIRIPIREIRRIRPSVLLIGAVPDRDRLGQHKRAARVYKKIVSKQSTARRKSKGRGTRICIWGRRRGGVLDVKKKGGEEGDVDVDVDEEVEEECEREDERVCEADGEWRHRGRITNPVSPPPSSCLCIAIGDNGDGGIETESERDTERERGPEPECDLDTDIPIARGTRVRKRSKEGGGGLVEIEMDWSEGVEDVAEVVVGEGKTKPGMREYVTSDNALACVPEVNEPGGRTH
ncbi:hypothetical protein MKEN_00591900 [Mycena kentingensis (nom. inval.)]|nr:hypothetical protein MKEN_00591900 [Mycena kentingensis (nom. inval.)]